MTRPPVFARKAWRIAAVGHFLLSTAGFWLLLIVSLGVAESNYGPPPWWLGALDKVVSFGLLQPVAHWVLTFASIRYWTWPGLVLSIAVFALNSLLAVGLCRVLVGAARRARRRRV